MKRSLTHPLMKITDPAASSLPTDKATNNSASSDGAHNENLPSIEAITAFSTTKHICHWQPEPKLLMTLLPRLISNYFTLSLTVCFHSDKKDDENEADITWCHRCYLKNYPRDSQIHVLFQNKL